MVSKKEIQRWAVNALIICLLFGNLNGMLHAWHTNFTDPYFSRIPYFSNLFRIYSVFSGTQLLNRRYVAMGACDTTSTAKVNLHIENYFPQSHGEANRRMGFMGAINRRKMMDTGYNQMAKNIKAIYNSQHPDKPLQRVVIYLLYWPSDHRGYYYNFNNSKITNLGSD
jgi:hypothetical protein